MRQKRPVTWQKRPTNALACLQVQRLADELVAAHKDDNRKEHVSAAVKQDEFTQKVTEDFDFAFEGSVSFQLPSLQLKFLPPDFKLGLLVGPSGSGKTTLLRKFGEICEPTWDATQTVIAQRHFRDMSSAEAQELLRACLLTSKEWCRPYAGLSDGEKARADAAALLAAAVRDSGKSEGERARVLIDEFTSLLDRRTAARLSREMCAYIARKNVRGVVLATCHKDVMRFLAQTSESLEWVLWTDHSTLYKGKALKQLVASVAAEEDTSSMMHEDFAVAPAPQVLCDTLRQPEIRLKCSRTKHTVWTLFRQHHYLNDSVHVSARCTLFAWQKRSYDDARVLGHEVVGFVGSLIQPGKYTQDTWRESRTVVLPDLQGLGLGPRLSDAVARLFFLQGYRYTSKTSHPRFSAYRDASQEWRCTKKERASHRPNWGTPEMIEKFLKLPQRQRTTSAYEWIGNEQDRAVFKQAAQESVYNRWEASKNSSESASKSKRARDGEEKDGRNAKTARAARMGGGSKGKAPEEAAETAKEADKAESSDESHDEMDLGADGGEVQVSQMSKGCGSVAVQSPPAAVPSAKPTPIATARGPAAETPDTTAKGTAALKGSPAGRAGGKAGAKAVVVKSLVGKQSLISRFCSKG